VTTSFLVDTLNPTGYSQVLEEGENGTVVRRYTYGLDLVSQEQASGVSFYGYDGHGSVRVLTDAAGAVTDTYGYDAFGGLIQRFGNLIENYQFSGEEYDQFLNLYYLRTRYYDGEAGRFISSDTHEGFAAYPASLQQYIYVYNDPLNNHDPVGTFGLSDIMAAITVQSIVSRMRWTLSGLKSSIRRVKGILFPLQWPVPGHTVLNVADQPGEGDGNFGTPRNNSSGVHNGIDIQAPVGSEIVAFRKGKVVLVVGSDNGGYGRQVVLDHGEINGSHIFSQSAHLDSVVVATQQYVYAGQEIGKVGRSGNVPPQGDSHLHFEIRIGNALAVSQGGTVRNPINYLQAGSFSFASCQDPEICLLP
jgi:RHS repeat-associated protein